MIDDAAVELSSVGAVVVNYNAGAVLGRCIASLRAAGVSEIVIADSGSDDGSLVAIADADATVRLLPMGENRGYGTAANRGVAVLEAPYALICNADVAVAIDAPRRLLAALEADRALAVVGPAIRDAAGQRYPSARRVPRVMDAAGHAIVGLFNPNNPWSARYRGDDVDRTIDGDAEWLSGACLLVRREAFASIGGFDEGYFMYVEDLDLCWRFRRAGWRVRYVSSAEIMHIQGVSARRHPYRMLAAHHRSTFRFARKSTKGAQRALLPLTGGLLLVRLAVAVAREFTKRR